MKRQEAVIREILYTAMEKKNFDFTQSELSKKLSVSLSIVNGIVKKLESIGAVRVFQRGFKVVDVKKILLYWASIRNLERDIIFKARVEMPVREIERIMPEVLFTAYTAYKLKFNDVPADYSEIYVYADEKELEVIKKRAGITKDYKPNFFVLKKDENMKDYKSATIGQIFVDLWNLREWYSKEFLNSLELKI